MTPQEHREKAEKIERSLGKCGPADYEMRIEAAMLAGTHWLNLVLHRMASPCRRTTCCTPYMLTVNELRRYKVADEALVNALAEIEDIRPAFVRGNFPGGEKAADRAVELLGVLREKAKG